MDNTVNSLSPAPLSASQQGIYLAWVSQPDSVMYNICFSMLLPASTDLGRFEAALRRVTALHPALSATVGLVSGVPMLLPGSSPCPIIRRQAESRTAAEKDFLQPFDLEKGPLARFVLCDTPEGTVFILDCHHIIFDGSSLNLLLNQLADAYIGKEPEKERVSLFEAAREEEGLTESPAYQKAREFFRSRLEGTDPDTAPVPDAGNVPADKAPGMLSMSDPALDPASVEAFCRRQGIRESVLFTAAFAYTLAVFSGSNAGCFTTVSSGRYSRREALANTVGMFVKTMPLRLELPEDGRISGFLQNVQREFTETLRHECISFAELAESYGVNTDISFVYQSSMLGEIRRGDWALVPRELPGSIAQSNILCMVLKHSDRYEALLQYRCQCYSEGFARSMAETFLTVVKGLLRCEKLQEIGLLSDRQKALIAALNRTERPYDPQETLSSLLRVTLQDVPEQTALVWQDRCYSYRDFDRITKQLAAFTVRKGLGKDDFVAVLAPRNDAAVLAAWGILRAGAAYQPLDPSYPPERLKYMVQDSGTRLLIAERSLRPLLSDYSGDVLYTDEFSALPEAPDFRDRAVPEGAAALIYTSGTTGKPKGCVLENRNLAAFCRNHTEAMQLDRSSRVASYASFGFDAGIMDIVSTPAAGGCLYILPDEIRLDLGQVEAFYCENGITHGFMTTQVGRMFAEETRCPSLKAFLVGGEKLVPFTPQKRFRFINGYGPCESMAYICCHEVRDNSPVQPIGLPRNNTKLYVRDQFGRQLPVGAVGELCIASLQLGRGYLGLPEKTASVFVPNPFCDAPGLNRMYRSGDVVRRLPDGELEFIGRRDGQVKIRGFRVELTEIEEVIRRFRGIKDATVAAFDEPGGGKYIAAYVTSDETVDIRALNDFIRTEKPAYMVPAVTVQLEAIPYTQNQKVNKRALPLPKRNSAAQEPPESDTQRTVFRLAAGILGHEDFGINTDLFEAGLSSIGTLKLNAELGKTFSTPVKLTDIRKHASVKALAAFLDQAQGNEPDLTVSEDYPLMQNQLGVFLDAGADSQSVKYNIPALFRLSDSLDPEKLAAAVRAAIDAHPFIKAELFTDGSGNVRLRRRDEAAAKAELIRTAALPAPGGLVCPFTLLDGPLYRAAVYCTPAGNYLFLDIHHILSDGTSLGILLRDISTAYGGSLPEKESFTGFEAALLEEKHRSSDAYADSLAYFDRLLSGCNTECLPDKCPESAAPPESCAHFHFSFKASEAILRFCREHALSENAFFNAVFSYALARFLHTDDVSYCTVYNGRNDSRLAESCAMLVRTLPVRAVIPADSSAEAFAAMLGKQLLDSMANDCVPFSELSNRYGLRSDLFFNYQGDSFCFDRIGGEPAEMLPLPLAEAKAPLSVEVFLENGSFRADMTYRTDIFCEAFAASLAGALDTAAAGFTENVRLSRISLLSEEEAARLDAMNSTDTPFESVPAQALFEKWAETEPDRVAVKTAEAALSFGELNRLAEKLAAALLKRGVKREEIVGLILNRTELVPAAEIGLLKAGCAFLPMLPTYPDERLEYCLTDAECRWVITTEDIIAEKPLLFSEDRPYRVLSLEALLREEAGPVQKPDIRPDQLAYCIYTSGSTGTPKGVMIEQHNLSNFVQTAALRETEARCSTILCMASISFDMSVTEIFFSLCQGKTVYIASEEEIHNLDLLLKAFTGQKIDLMMMTPSFAWNLLSLPEFEGALGQLQSVVLGAEAFQPALFAKLKALNPEMLIQNGYGPTECTQVCSVKTLTDGKAITIGRPFANTRFYVTDSDGNLLPRYALGELIIAGEGVCRGYVKLPEKNAAAFTEIRGRKAYRSGDLVRINRDSEAEFGGRADNQVKLRGFRIELDEIEAVMQEFEGISQSKVIVRGSGAEAFLAGYFTAAVPVDTDALTEHLKSKLTYYMVPAALMQLDKMPMTPNGKLDKKALPEIRPVRKAKNRRAPKKSLEEKILDLFRSVLNLDECYVDDNFFEIGGTSLTASKAVMQLKSQGYKIEYQDIFDHQSAGELAEYLESLSAAAPAAQSEADTAKTETEAWSEQLKYNCMEYADEVRREPLGDVLLTGATGFLGVHILKTLLETEEGRIYCLLRRGRYRDVTTRLQSALYYYFEQDYVELFGDRLTVLEGDITDGDLAEHFRDISFDTLINCAACVKHYANDNSIEFVNVHGAENLIRLTKEKNAKMIQISTTSVPGAHTPETYRVNLRMTEDRLFVVDDMNNQYCQSKYQAELRMLEAIRDGMRGKIIRVGNLMGRYSDGEFQTNLRTNAFLNGLRGFVNIGKCPISHATDPMSFSPVDCTARAVVLLAGTNDIFTAFHADSRSTFDEMKVIEAINRCGIPVTPVPDEEYYADFYRMMADPKMNEKVSALLTNDRPDMHMVETDSRFTANILYRLGFSWPFIDDAYLEKVITSLDTLDFFFQES